MESGQDRPETGPPLVFVGDSITAGWGACRAETFARHGFLARGVPGETSGQIRTRFSAAVAGARGVHLLCGINDLAEIEGPVSDAALRENFLAMMGEARERGLPLWIGAVMPTDFGGWRRELAPVARIRALNAWLREHALACGAGFIDYHTPLATRSGALRPEFTEDAIHLTPAGYIAVEPAMLAALAPGAR